MENRIFLNRYRLSLGRNGLPVEMHRAPAAKTYRGHEIDTGREVALTIVTPAPSDLLVLEKLETEAIASEKVNHVNIPRLYDFGCENEELIYVSEYWEGHTASAWVEARGPLTVAAVLRVALQVTDAMNATVFQRVYHPALNPDNILFVLGQTGEGDWPPIKILHWHGPRPTLAQPVDERAENAARFAAPEQLREGKIDVRSEIYSLGLTMWFLLTGMLPVPGDSDGLRIATSTLRGVPKIVRHLLERMVRTEPRERPQDPVALASYLQTCLARVERRAKMERRIGVPLTTQPRVAAPRTPMPGKGFVAALAVMLVAALGLLFLTLALTKRSSAQLTANTGRISETPHEKADVPNEPNIADEGTTAEEASTEQADAKPTSSPAAVVAAAPSDSPGELISVSPVPATVASAGSASKTESAPPDQLHAAPRDQATSEPLPPAKGPQVENDRQVVLGSQTAPRDESSPNEINSGGTVPSTTAESNEPDSAAISAPSQVADSSASVEAKASPSATAHKTSLARATTKAPTTSSRDTSKTHLAKDRSQAGHTVKRAQPLPKLRVGSSPAEFVGTTRDGHWILSVASTGERVIVPPPPGYGE